MDLEPGQDLVVVASTDLYIRLLSLGVLADPRWIVGQ